MVDEMTFPSGIDDGVKLSFRSWRTSLKCLDGGVGDYYSDDIENNGAYFIHEYARHNKIGQHERGCIMVSV